MASHSRRRLASAADRPAWRMAVPVAMIAAGVLFVASAISADGTDLRSVTTDLRTLVLDRGSDVEAARQQVEGLRGEVDALSAGVDNAIVREARRDASELRPASGLTEVNGSGLRITLSDAPRAIIDGSGYDPNLLVVHQQDIQAFVNAMWAAGAEAVSLQGQRLISTTAIKCVGTVVLLHDVPYAPPYVIEAVGDTTDMYAALNASAKISLYREYVESEDYQLGLEVELEEELTIPAYEGSLELEHARALEG